MTLGLVAAVTGMPISPPEAGLEGEDAVCVPVPGSPVFVETHAIVVPAPIVHEHFFHCVAGIAFACGIDVDYDDPGMAFVGIVVLPGTC